MYPDIRECLYCGTEFKTYSNNRLYCDEQCGKYYRQLQNPASTTDKGGNKVQFKDCAVCKTRFRTRAEERVTCSDDCELQRQWQIKARRKAAKRVEQKQKARNKEPVLERPSDYPSLDAWLARKRPTWSTRRVGQKGRWYGHPWQQQWDRQHRGLGETNGMGMRGGGTMCELCKRPAPRSILDCRVPYDHLCKVCHAEIQEELDGAERE